MRPGRDRMAGHDVELVAKKAEWDANFFNVLPLQSLNVLNGCSRVVCVDRSELWKTFAVVREAQRHNGNAHDIRVELQQVAEAALQIRAIVYSRHEHNLSM